MDVNRAGEMEVFVRVVETGSFSAAARALDLSPSAVAKLVGRLEQRLGARLINRSTRLLGPTPEGEIFYERAVGILADITEAEGAVAKGAEVPRGRIRISATVPLGTHLLVPLIPSFLERHPQVNVDLNLSDVVIDLIAERTDVAIRSGPLRDSTLKARKLGESRRVIVASPNYFKRHGKPRTPADLARHNCINFNFRRASAQWALSGASTPQVPSNIQVNNGETMRQLVLAGVGLGRLAHFHVIDDLRARRLVTVLDDEPGDVEEIHAVYLGQGRMPARIRTFIDFLVEGMRIR
jgi:DNA-binding transcriptional LysR family regulator